MANQREFLGWEEPALPQAVRQLAVRYVQGESLNLGHVLIVVPGQRAGRRLQELLAYLADEKKLRLTPPRVITTGHLPEMLYTPKRPFANDIVQDLAWVQALRDLPVTERVHLVPHPPADGEALRWLDLAKTFRVLHVELAADGLDFQAVLATGPRVANFTEEERWQALVAVQRCYHDLLDELQLWDKQTARLKAIKLREIHSDCDIILLGTVDLNNMMRQMLAQVAERVAAYIVAPESEAERFDELGCLRITAWCKADVPLRDPQLIQVDGPGEQADAVTAWLEELGGRYRKEEIAIGVPDEALVPQLQRQLEQFGMRGRWLEGERVAETAPYRLLAAAVQFAGQRRYEDLAALLRHPDVEDLLQRDPTHRVAPSLPAQLDNYYNKRFPSKIQAGQSLGSGDDWPDLPAALKRLDTWLGNASERQPLSKWGDLFRSILGDIYGKRTLDLDVAADEVLHRTIRKILEGCACLGSLPVELDTMSLTAADAFQVALGPLARDHLAPPADPDALEILGWLELPLDDSPALIVTSFNEGFVPQAAAADAFLPDRLRRELGLVHNERRYARDAYAMTVLCRSRPELKAIFARRDTRKDPIQPSRYLFACPDPEMVQRAAQFFDKPKSEPSRRPLLLGPAQQKQSRFQVPQPERVAEKLQRISVTRFKAYLACPYRYYLRHVRKLEAIDDSARELDGGSFGTLLHNSLAAFGRDPDGPRNSDDEKKIFEYLDEQISARTKTIYGMNGARPAIQLQLEQARFRLRAFAARQAELRHSGWEIRYAEPDYLDSVNSGLLFTPFPSAVQLIILEGRIDRIDVHPQRKCVCIIDYKTADKAETPDKTHRKRGKWIDLQLPLYRHLWRKALESLSIPEDWSLQLAYFNLPKKIGELKVQAAEWTDADLTDADQRAEEVVRAILAETFWPVTTPPPDYGEEFSAICLDRVLRRPAFSEDDVGGAP